MYNDLGNLAADYRTCCTSPDRLAERDCDRRLPNLLYIGVGEIAEPVVHRPPEIAEPVVHSSAATPLAEPILWHPS
jgi:hypothetical protein